MRAKYVFPQNLVPIPQATVKSKNSKPRRKGQTFILTDTPVELRLQKEQEEKTKANMKTAN